MPFFRHDVGLADPALLLAGSARSDIDKPTVYVVDHDLAVRDSLSLILRFSGFDVLTYPSGERFIKSLPVSRKGCLLVEFDLEDMTGPALIERLTREHCALPAIVMSARLRLPASRIRLPSHVPILQKPFGQDQLLEVIRHAMAGR